MTPPLYTNITTRYTNITSTLYQYMTPSFYTNITARYTNITSTLYQYDTIILYQHHHTIHQHHLHSFSI